VLYTGTNNIQYSSRMIEIQTTMSERAVELLCLPNAEEGGSKFLLDLGTIHILVSHLISGCGSGLSGSVLEDNGHFWVGLDISKAMLDVAVDREVEGDLLLADMGQGLFFRPGTFDGVISISAVQWLMNADKSSHDPRKRLKKFFQSLYACMSRGARAVFQFYPENAHQMELLTGTAMACGFNGGLVVDFPNSTRAKKYFLCLSAGSPTHEYTLPKGLGEDVVDEEAEGARFTAERRAFKGRKARESVKNTKDWVLKKKESQRKKGIDTRPDSKYTARKRSGFRA
jgi:18S rRNA (guanine1575-N7)-methyltransferase